MIQVVSGSTAGGPITANPSYTCLLGGWRSAISSVEMTIWDVVGIACVVRNVFLRLTAAPGLGRSWVFTVRVNQIDTAVSFTIADLATFGTYTATDLHLAVGDVVSVRCDPSALAPTSTFFGRWGYEVETTDPYQVVFFGATSAGVINSVAERYSGLFDHLSTWDRLVDGGPASVYNINPLDGVITGYRLSVARNPIFTRFLTATFTIYKSTDSGVTFVAQDGSGGTPDTRKQLVGAANFTQHSTSFSLPTKRGDLLYLRADTIDADGGQWSVATCVLFTSSEAYHWPYCGKNNSLIASNTQNEFAPIMAPQAPGWTTGEGGRQISDAGYTDFSLGREIVWISAPPGVGKSRDFITRLNLASQTLHVLISDNAIVGEDLIHSVPLSFGDTFDLMTTPSGTPTSAAAIWGYVQVTAAPASICEMPLPADGGSVCGDQMALPEDSGGGSGEP